MPGPLPACRPDFPPEFLDQARAVLRRRTVRYQLRQRAEPVLLLHRRPTLPNTEAAARVRLHPNSVRAWRRRWAAGDFALEDEAGPRWRAGRAGAARPPFPPLDAAVVKAIACEAVAQTGLPLSRRSLDDLTARAHWALGKPISRSTVWRILDGDAIKPWRYEHRIFP